jgi:hypothetical protein
VGSSSFHASGGPPGSRAMIDSFNPESALGAVRRVSRSPLWRRFLENGSRGLSASLKQGRSNIGSNGSTFSSGASA